SKYFPLAGPSARQVELYDPKTKQFTMIDTCFAADHNKFDDKDTIVFGQTNAIGWFDTAMFDKTHDAAASQGWCPAVIDTNGDAIGSDGSGWQNWRGAHEILKIDRSKCKVLNGPTATGQQCAEGWTVYKKEGPAFEGAPDDFRTDMLYLTEVDRENALGLGKDVVLAGDVNADSF